MAAPLTHPLNCIRGHYPMARHVTSCITVFRDRQGLRYNVTWSRQTLRYNVTWHSTRWQSGQVHWLTVGWLGRMCETATRQNARKFNGRKEGSLAAGSQCHCHTPSPCNGHLQSPQCPHDVQRAFTMSHSATITCTEHQQCPQCVHRTCKVNPNASRWPSWLCSSQLATIQPDASPVSIHNPHR